MVKTYGKYVIISSFILVLAIILASCGGGGVSGVSDTPTTGPAPTFSPSTTTTASGYVYMTPEGDYKIINASSSDLTTAVTTGIVNGAGISSSSDDETVIKSWLGGFQALGGASIYLGTDSSLTQTADSNGFFSFTSVPLYDTSDPNNFVYFGLTPPGSSDSYFFEDYLFPDGDTFKNAALSSSTAGYTLVSTPKSLFLVSPSTRSTATEVFWVRGIGTDGKAVDLKSKTFTVTNTGNLGTVKFPYYVGTDKTRAYGFINVGKGVSGSTTIQIATEGVNVSIPVEIVNKNSTGKVKGTVLHDGKAPAFGWVESVGPWAWDMIDFDGSYSLWKVYSGSSRTVKATYWVWNGSDFQKYTLSEIISLSSGETKTLNLTSGTTGSPTATPVTGPTATPIPSASWHNISTNLSAAATTATLLDVHFISANNGLISSDTSSQVYLTTDGGSSFTTKTVQAVPYLTPYICTASTEFYGGAQNGRIYRSTDSGTNWTSLGTTSNVVNSITFPPSSNTGYSCGANGSSNSITSSSIGGSLTTGSSNHLTSITFPTSTEGWLCGNTVIRHFVSGAWTADQTYSSSNSYQAIYFINSNTGWAVGTNGVIIHTTDGKNWIAQTNPDTQSRSLYDVFFVNTSEGWAVGNNGIILHTTNGGSTWEVQTSGTTNAINSVYFTSATNGYAVGDNRTLLKFNP